MIKLYGFGPSFGMPDSSPFVCKIDLYLRVCGIEFESVNNVSNLRKAPKAKLPFIEDNGELIADTVFIIDHLKQQHSADVDSWLAPEQRASAQLIGKSIDENLYWSVVHSRWINDDTWPIIRAQFFDSMPFPLNKIVPSIARRATQKQLVGHGIGKHSDAQVQDIARRSLDSLEVLLGDKDYFFGDKISSLDITVFGTVGALALATIDNEMNQLARSYEKLNRLLHRIKHDYYPDL
jgi:glutathione S-transferase